MSTEGDEARELFEEIKRIAPGFEKYPAKMLRELIGFAIQESTSTNKSIEERIDAAGSIPPDISGVLLHYGALVAIIEDLPPEEPRRLLVDAGRAIGRFIAKRTGKKLAEKLRNPQ